MSAPGNKQTPPRGVCSTVTKYLDWWRRTRDIRRKDSAYDRFMGTLVDVPLPKVPLRLAEPGSHTAEYMLRNHMRADWAGVDPDLMFFAASLIERLRKQDIPFYCHTARRTPTQQALLYQHGRSKVFGPQAPHTVGAAVDLVHGKHHWELTGTEWRFVGIVGKDVARHLGLEVQWGGDWDYYDPAHWQLPDWKERAVLPGEDVMAKVHRTPRNILRNQAWELA